jgi:hypothetical protein
MVEFINKKLSIDSSELEQRIKIEAIKNSLEGSPFGREYIPGSFSEGPLSVNLSYGKTYKYVCAANGRIAGSYEQINWRDSEKYIINVPKNWQENRNVIFFFYPEALFDDQGNRRRSLFDKIPQYFLENYFIVSGSGLPVVEQSSEYSYEGMKRIFSLFLQRQGFPVNKEWGQTLPSYRKFVVGFGTGSIQAIDSISNNTTHVGLCDPYISQQQITNIFGNGIEALSKVSMLYGTYTKFSKCCQGGDGMNSRTRNLKKALQQAGGHSKAIYRLEHDSSIKKWFNTYGGLLE